MALRDPDSGRFSGTEGMTLFSSREEKVMRQNYGGRTPVISVARDNHRRDTCHQGWRPACEEGKGRWVCGNVARKKGKGEAGEGLPTSPHIF